MRKLAIMFVAVLLIASAAHAQSPAAKGPMSTWLRGAYQEYRAYFVRSAEKMPESMYGMRPGVQQEVRTFGQILGHVANDNYYSCSAAKGEKNPKAGMDLEKLGTKEEMVKALNDSFTYCDGAYDAISDASGLAVVTITGEDGRPMQMPRMGLLVSNYGHVCEHYGNLVTYMRIKGIVPPSSEPPQR